MSFAKTFGMVEIVPWTMEELQKYDISANEKKQFNGMAAKVTVGSVDFVFIYDCSENIGSTIIRVCKLTRDSIKQLNGLVEFYNVKGKVKVVTAVNNPSDNKLFGTPVFFRMCWFADGGSDLVDLAVKSYFGKYSRDFGTPVVSFSEL
jgi:hypothetical protein